MSKGKRLYKTKGKVIKGLTLKIIKVFNESPSKSLNYKQIAAKLSIYDTDSRGQIINRIEELKSQGKFLETSKGKYKINLDKFYYKGSIDLTYSGNAYFKCDDLQEDVFIPSTSLNKALQNDIVKVYVYNNTAKDRRQANVIEIIERAKNVFVGVLQINNSFGFVIADDSKMYVDIFVAKNKLNGAKDGEKVSVVITSWPENSKKPYGEITNVLGWPGDHDTEMNSILLEYNLPIEFPKEVELEANSISQEISSEQITNRKDMRFVNTFTIDPEDAKDFDDAISMRELENGNIEIGVHIADVSHYVLPDTLLDNQAYYRAFSVYLVDRVIPMLPEILSNKVCSLLPNEDKLTFSAVFQLDKKVNVVNTWFGRTVIHSDYRFTYEQAQEIIEQKKGNFSKELLLLNHFAKKLRAKRIKKDSIIFDKVEVKFNLDKKNNPIGVYFKESKDANKLIEEFMLLANKKVAEFIGFQKGKPSGKTFIYRTHDKPDADKLVSLQNIVSKLGYKIDTLNKKTIANSLNKLLKDVHGKAESNLVETLTIRSMSKAKYTTDNIGHYGLAFDYYSHFTSPIRRYPDIITHRLLQHYLDNGKSPSALEYEEKCKHSSEREQLAVKAERSSVKYMQVKYMKSHKGQVFKGVISGVTEWGIYVEILENKCEGMVRKRDISDDYYSFDESQYALVGRSKGNIYKLGDYVKIKVKNTDVERKHLDFDLILE